MIQVPPAAQEDHFVYYLNKGIVYESSKLSPETIMNYNEAQEFCEAKNKSLINPESKQSTEIIRKLLESHISSYNYQEPKYLLGNETTRGEKALEKLECARFLQGFEISRAILPPILHGKKAQEISIPIKIVHIQVIIINVIFYL